MNLYNTELSLQDRDDLFLPTSLFDEIELSLSRICNRKCIHCPHGNEDYVNFNSYLQEFMDIYIIKKILNELISINFTGMIILSGFGEPTLHPNFLEIFQLLLDSGIRIRVVTNGCRFGDVEFLEKFKSMVENHNAECIISVYEKMDIEVFEQYDFGVIKEIFFEDSFIESFEKLKFNNRAGSINHIMNDNDYTSCNYCVFMLVVDTNGDVQYCPHEWTKELIVGNINDSSLLDIWREDTNLRICMINDERQSLYVCRNCSTKGNLIAEEKMKLYKGDFE